MCSSSTSSSKGPYALFGRMVVFAALTWALAQGFRLFGLSYPHWEPPVRAGDHLYLAADDFFYDHVAYMFEETGPIEAARRADLLFLGNSRMMFGVNYQGVMEALEGTGAHPHWMGLGVGETWKLPTEIVQERHLAPKLVVVNCDADYFGKGYSVFAKYLKALGPERSLKMARNKNQKNRRWRLLMRIFPVPQFDPWSLSLKHTRVPYVYRSVEYGDWVVVDPALMEKATQAITKPGPAPLPENFPQQVENARRLLDLTRARGGEMVFIVVPNHDHDESVALALGRELGVTVLVEPDWTGYETFDVSHLKPASSLRYTRHIFAKLKETPEWRRAFGQ